jgi:MinD-like ATPase involved in chromosome partitioning or flagellar assembly/DNA-binding NarL/FixJ family response regulator
VDEPQIALAASPREWAQRLHRHVADHGGARVRATVLHPTDAIAESYDVFIGDDSTSFLTRRLVDELHRRGRAVLGVFDPDDPRGKGELLDIGVDEVISRSASPEDFVSAIGQVALGRARPLDDELDDLLRAELGDDVLTDPVPSNVAFPLPPERQTPRIELGQVTAVAATSGGVGATEVAIGLAQASGRRGDTTALVDADEIAPAIAQRLGQPQYPNIRAAVDSLEHRTTRLSDVLVPVPRGRFAVVPGLSSSRNWSELRPGETVDVVRSLTSIRRHVIVNVGHRLEDLHGMGGPPRHGIARAVIGAADAIVGVAHPSPVGMARLLEWLADVRSLTSTSAVHVIFNRAPSSSFKQGELIEELSRSFTPAGVWFAPADHRVEAAAWAGDLVSSGPFTKALGAAADVILPTSTNVSRRRRKRVTA